MGARQPVVLLHGGLGASEMFGEVLALLAQDHQVIDTSACVGKPTTGRDMAIIQKVRVKQGGSGIHRSDRHRIRSMSPQRDGEGGSGFRHVDRLLVIQCVGVLHAQ